jgi:nitroreductase
MKKRFNQVPLSRYQARYGEEVTDIEDPKNGLIDRMLGRRSARSFLPEALPDGTLERLIAAAQSAPTSSMMQSWSVINITDPAVKQKIIDLGAEKIGERNIHMIRTAPIMLLWVADLHRLDKMTWKTPAQGLTNTAEIEMSAIIDATIAAQTLAVCAEAMALGTCAAWK